MIGGRAALGAGAGIAEGGGAHKSAGGETAARGESVEGIAFVFGETDGDGFAPLTFVAAARHTPFLRAAGTRVPRGDMRPYGSHVLALWSSPGVETPAERLMAARVPRGTNAPRSEAPLPKQRTRGSGIRTRRAGGLGGISPVGSKGQKGPLVEAAGRISGHGFQGSKKAPFGQGPRAERPGPGDATGMEKSPCQAARCDRAWLAHPDIRISRISLRLD